MDDADGSRHYGDETLTTEGELDACFEQHPRDD